MKNIILLLTVVVAVSQFTACMKNSSDEKSDALVQEANRKKEDAENKVDDYEAREKSIAESEYQIFKDRTELKIQENELKIEKMKLKVAEADNNSRERLNKRIIELEEKSNRIKNRLADYKETGSEEWEAFKNEFNHDMDELETALKGFAEDDKK